MACIIRAWGLHRVLHGDTRCVQEVMAWPHHHCGATCARCQFLGAPCPVGACCCHPEALHELRANARWQEALQPSRLPARA